MQSDKMGKNIEKPVTTVNHSDLKKTADSIFRSHCPACKEGVLLVRRDNKTLQLEEYDVCILCGQRFKYRDIAKMRERDAFN